MIGRFDHKLDILRGTAPEQLNELEVRCMDLEQRCKKLGKDAVELYSVAKTAKALPQPEPQERVRGLKKLKNRKKNEVPQPSDWERLVDDARLERKNAQVLLARFATLDSSAMHVAARSNHVAAARLLVHLGATVDAESENAEIKGLRPLHYCAQLGHLELAELLIANGADLRQAWNGSSPVHLAAQTGKTPLVALLQNKGCEDAGLPCEDQYGATALHTACINEQWDCARDILKRGKVHSGHIDKDCLTAVQYGNALKELRLFPENPLEEALLLGHVDLAINAMAELDEREQKQCLEQLWSVYPKETYGPMFAESSYKPLVVALEVLQGKHEADNSDKRLGWKAKLKTLLSK